MERLESRDLLTSIGADFNGDGFDDLAIGVPKEDIGNIRDAGAVNVIYGSNGTGLTSRGNQLWHQGVRGVKGKAEAGDLFGNSIAAGDFNGDGYDDLAIGAPNENWGTIVDAGAINVLYGSANVGLTTRGNQVFSQNIKGIRGVAEVNDFFGSTLSVGDYNGDGFDDLAIGVPGEDWGNITDAGAINILYGSATVGLTAKGNQVFSQNIKDIGGVAEKYDRFGSSLSSGDYNADGKDDLAIGVPFEDWGNIKDAGAINVIYGSDPVGLTAAGNQVFSQATRGIRGKAEAGDQFGQSLASGDFNGDGRDDLAIGAPKEDWGTITDAGAINVIYGSRTVGLTNSGNQVFAQNIRGIKGVARQFDKFGYSLIAGDFNGDGRDDLAIGVMDDNTAVFDGGAVNVLYGAQTVGLTANANQIFTQNTPGIRGVAEQGDNFGLSLFAGDFDGNGRYDLAVGVSRESINSKMRAGAVNVIYGSTTVGLTSRNNQLWHQNSPGILGVVEAYDYFGRFRGEFWGQF